MCSFVLTAKHFYNTSSHNLSGDRPGCTLPWRARSAQAGNRTRSKEDWEGWGGRFGEAPPHPPRTLVLALTQDSLIVYGAPLDLYASPPSGLGALQFPLLSEKQAISLNALISCFIFI